jgi:hypothetical protein
MTLRERINLIIKEEDEKFLKKDMNKLNHIDVKGIDKIVCEIKALKEKGIYDKLLKAYKIKFKDKYLDPDDHLTIYEGMQTDFFNLAYLNLTQPNIHLPKLTDLISLSNINSMDEIIENIYFMNLGKKMTHADMTNITLSGLMEKVVFALENFDQTSTPPKITAEFFQKLRKVKWKNKSVKKLFWNLSDMRIDLIMGSIGVIQYGGLISAEDQFLLLLASSSCVQNERNKIINDDVIKAYNTYIKLLNIDITQYTAASTCENYGFLFCKNCNGYYPLKENETPNDFEQCQCGEKLIYYDINDFKQ